MKEVVFGNQTVVVDEVRTLDFYDRLSQGWPHLDWCQCDGCTNTRMTRIRFMAPDQQSLLRSMGLDPQNPARGEGMRQNQPASKKYYRWSYAWYLYASFDRTKPAPKQIFESDGWIWMDESESEDEKYVRISNHHLLDNEGLVRVRTSNIFPWLYGEVDEFKSERGSGCPECGREWRQVGDLKDDSMIPDWYEKPELRRILLAKKERVRVSLCSHCGHLEYELTKR